MARIYTHHKGKAGSHRIRRDKHPDWSALNPREVESHIVELAKKGMTASEIGIHLRDQYAVPDVRAATGKRIGQILARNNMLPEIPDDLKSLIRTALRLQRHLEEHKKDLKTKRDLQLTESKIRRLTKYYHRINRLPKGWEYTPEQAKVMFEST